MRLFLLILAVLMPCSASAWIHGLFIANYLPPTQTVNFGVKTLVGYGGSPMGYSNPAVLGVSRFITILSQVDASSNPVSIFQIDDRQQLVTKNGAGAYGALWSAPANGPYTVVVTDGVGVSTITVSILANTSTIREMTSAANGCAVNCEVTNPDGGTGAFNFAASQISGVLASSTILAGGETVIARSGFFNPSGLLYRLRPPATGWTLAGSRTLLESEVQDTSVDTNGNLNNKSGFQIGYLLVDSATSGNINIPLDFSYIWFYQNTTITEATLLKFGQGASWGEGVHYSRFEIGPNMNSSSFQLLDPSGGNTIDHNIFTEASGQNGSSAINTPLNNSTGAHGQTILNNVAYGLYDDFIDLQGGGNDIENNFAFNFFFFSGDHPDCMQVVGALGTGQNLGTIAKNFCVRNVEQGSSTGLDAQGVPFIRNVINNNTYSGATITNNISNITAHDCIFVSATDNPVANYNDCLMVLQNSNPSTLSAIIITALGGSSGTVAGIAGTFNNNVANATPDASTQSGTPTVTDNLSIPVTATSPVSTYQSTFPNYLGGDTPSSNPGLVNRAAVIAMFTPSANGSAKNGDGTYAGVLFPANNFGEVCWNDGTVPNPAAHCTPAQ